jgi:hypothetical protein
MDGQDTAPVASRRALLAGAVGAATALAVSSVRPGATRGADGDNALLGQLNTATEATLVHASGDEVTAFLGRSTSALSGIGVEGWAQAPDAAGGRFVASSDTGITFGAIGRTHSADGVGVYARNLGGGVGLSVDGQATFRRSGKTIVKAGNSSKRVLLSGVTASSMVLAILAQSRSGRYVRAAVPATGAFTIYLNRAVAKDTKVSWFVLDPFVLL